MEGKKHDEVYREAINEIAVGCRELIKACSESGVSGEDDQAVRITCLNHAVSVWFHSSPAPSTQGMMFPIGAMLMPKAATPPSGDE